MTTTAAVRERPILFSGPMVRAILDGRKTQTRRVMKPQPTLDSRAIPPWPLRWKMFRWFEGGSMPDLASRCPYGVPGDRLWVREAFKAEGAFAKFKTGRVRYCADIEQPAYERGWTPSIHMPRWASRLTLELTAVRVQRVAEISTLDIRDEGISIENNGYARPGEIHSGARAEFEDLWDSLNAARGYPTSSNPWVWALTFRRVP